MRSGHFNQFEPGIFEPIIQAISSPQDPWLVAADFADYITAQQSAAHAYLDQESWTRMSILNTASAGKFSTDRTMQEYNEQIWKLQQVPSYNIETGKEGESFGATAALAEA